MPKPVTKEDVLIQDGIYNDLVNFRPVYIKNVVDSMETYAALQTGERDEEIERLKGLIKDAWWVHSYGTSNSFDSTGQYDAAWNQFKTDNKL